MTAGAALLYWLLLAAAPADQPGAGSPVPAGGKVFANRTAVPLPAGGVVGTGDSAEDKPIGRHEARAVPRGGAGGRAAGFAGGWWGRLEGLMPLLVVLLVIAALSLAARRLMPRKWRAHLTGLGVIEILARQYLAPKQSVALLKVGRRVVLVGVTAERVSHLETITDADEIAELVGRAASQRPGSLSSAFRCEVLNEAARYDEVAPEKGPSSDGAGGRSEAYARVRRQLQGLLTRVRVLAAAR